MATRKSRAGLYLEDDAASAQEILRFGRRVYAGLAGALIGVRGNRRGDLIHRPGFVY